MRIVVDPDRCQGQSRCHSIAPQVFRVDDYGRSTAVDDGNVPPGLEDRARLAMANCPERAISEVADAAAPAGPAGPAERAGTGPDG